jgi:hypothetical protein
MQPQRRRDTRELMDLGRVSELFFNRIRCRSLHELAESCPGIGKTPGRYLDAKAV